MRCLIFVVAFALAQSLAQTALADEIGPSEPQGSFQREIAARVHELEEKNAAATSAGDGWLFLTAELRLLAAGHFWGDAAVKISRSHKPELADPVPAILDFQRQLKERGIDLLLVPVPPKASVYPEHFVPAFNIRADDAAPYLRRFYAELHGQGVDVLDLTPLFLNNRENERGPVFCRTDTHWSGFGCTLAAQAIAEKVRAKVAALPPQKEYASEWKEIAVNGDLIGLLPPGVTKPAAEKIAIQSVSDKATGAAVTPDESSPLLVIGDSHTLVFHDFLAERAGLIDQLAQQLGFAPDLIGTRGSGATPVRISLYRRSHKDPAYLGKKKMVVWCFTAREFTEADEGWAKVPIAK